MQTQDREDDIIDLRQLASAIWRARWAVLGLLIVGWAVTVAIYLQKPRRFAAHSAFVFKSAEPNSSLFNIASMVGIRDLSSKGPDISSYYESVLFSDEFLSKVANRKYATKGDSVKLDELWKLEPAAPGDDYEYRMTMKRIGRLKGGKHILATKNKLTGVITLKTSFEDPLVSQQVNRLILELLEDHLRLDSKSQARENHRFILDRVEEIRGDLRRSEDALVAFNLANLNPTSPRLLLELSRLKREATLNQELFLELKKQLELAKIEELKYNPLVDVLSAAGRPLHPERRGMGKAMVLVTGVVGLLGMVLALLWHWFGIHFRKPRQPRAAAPA